MSPIHNLTKFIPSSVCLRLDISATFRIRRLLQSVITGCKLRFSNSFYITRVKSIKRGGPSLETRPSVIKHPAGRKMTMHIILNYTNGSERMPSIPPSTPSTHLLSHPRIGQDKTYYYDNISIITTTTTIYVIKKIMLHHCFHHYQVLRNKLHNIIYIIIIITVQFLCTPPPQQIHKSPVKCS